MLNSGYTRIGNETLSEPFKRNSEAAAVYEAYRLFLISSFLTYSAILLLSPSFSHSASNSPALPYPPTYPLSRAATWFSTSSSGSMSRACRSQGWRCSRYFWWYLERTGSFRDLWLIFLTYVQGDPSPPGLGSGCVKFGMFHHVAPLLRHFCKNRKNLISLCRIGQTAELPRSQPTQPRVQDPRADRTPCSRRLFALW